jgi:kynurenine 3-monooxygenase
MVTFHRIPYSIALARGVVQDAMLTELCDSIERVKDVDWARVEQMIRELAPLGRAS